MLFKPIRLWALLCFVLAIQLATAQSFQALKRQEPDGGPPATESASSPPPEQTDAPQSDSKQDGGDKAPESTLPSSDMTASITASPTSDPTTETQATSTIAVSSALDNSTFLNVSIPEGQLPIAPEITPGWGVAGIIMLITGVIYTLVGIKNRWIHTFFSTAYISALGVAVLIIYVMNIPVSNALQGGYVVAIVMSGCAIGAASMFFKELTEGLGCALGGFCISMWLLCLVPGGLLRTVASKAIFIACFTLVGFAFYFSRYTRDWALIVLISFGGATITVLGIDSFSRAGLKEFWAYIWDLNKDLFPLGADTYPVTKGIRVETAAIIIIFLVGIISQIKLWRIVREKREKRAAQRAEGQRNLDEEEENVGRQVEEDTARERREWERTYGDGGAESITASHYSDGGDVSSEKQLRGVVYAARHQSNDEIEMEEMSESSNSRRGPEALMADEGEEGKITVRVAEDEVPEYDEEEITTEKGVEAVETTQPRQKRHSTTSGKSKRVSRGSGHDKRHSVRSHPSPQQTQPPEVIPLPFTVPAGHEPSARSERSSVATFADEEDGETTRHSKRHSAVKRLSQGSANLLRSFSQKSGLSTEIQAHADNGQSSEELVNHSPFRDDADNGSLAANFDQSESGADVHSVVSEGDEKRKSIEVNAELAEKETPEAKNSKPIPTPQDAPAKTTTVRKSSAVAERVAAFAAMEDQLSVPKQQSRAPSPKIRQTPTVSDAPQSPEPAASSVHEPQPAMSEAPKSMASEESGPISLTKERLPPSLSRVALSYRTNEWAKHLSNADMPEPDEFPAEKPRRSSKSRKEKEKAKPVNVEDLQKTAEDGVPPVTVKRSESRNSQISAAPSAAANAAPADAPGVASPPAPVHAAIPSPPVPENEPPARNSISAAPPAPYRTASSSAMRKSSPNIQPIAEEEVIQPSRTPTVEEQEQFPPRPASLSHSVSQNEMHNRAPVPGMVSYSSPQTLLGQREAVLRSRSQGSLISNIGEGHGQHYSPPSEVDSVNNYPMYAAALASDPDDVPLRQRKEIMRQSSLMSLTRSSTSLHSPESRAESTVGGAENVAFNSHQPQRNSAVPSNAAREAKLANFRMSVSQELRSGSPMMHSGRETPFASTNSLLGGGREVEVQRNIEMQRHVLMGQKEAEAQRKEMQRRDREFSDRAFDDRMRSGDLMEAHREAMRKMQRGARG